MQPIAPTQQEQPITAEPVTTIVSKEEPEVTPRNEEPSPTAPRRSSLAGLSIASLMSSATSYDNAEEQNEEIAQEPTLYDPKSEEKLLAKREQVIKAILEERPRFVVAFEKMEVKGHTILLEVPSQTLYEEIMRSKTELLLTAARIAEVSGALELDIRINEQITVERPIKLEDRIKYMAEKNPQLLELKKILDMEYE